MDQMGWNHRVLTPALRKIVILLLELKFQSSPIIHVPVLIHLFLPTNTGMSPGLSVILSLKLTDKGGGARAQSAVDAPPPPTHSRCPCPSSPAWQERASLSPHLIHMEEHQERRRNDKSHNGAYTESRAHTHVHRRVPTHCLCEDTDSPFDPVTALPLGHSKGDWNWQSFGTGRLRCLILLNFYLYSDIFAQNMTRALSCHGKHSSWRRHSYNDGLYHTTLDPLLYCVAFPPETPSQNGDTERVTWHLSPVSTSMAGWDSCCKPISSHVTAGKITTHFEHVYILDY